MIESRKKELRELAAQMRNHVQKRGGPSHHANDPTQPKVLPNGAWTMMLGAADGLSEALDEIERLEAERDEIFDECNAGFVKATACLDVIARGKSIDPVKHAQRTLSELEESTNA